MKRIGVSIVYTLIFVSVFCQEPKSRKEIKEEKRVHLLQQISPYVQTDGRKDKESLKKNNLILISLADSKEEKVALGSKMYFILKNDTLHTKINGRLYKLDGSSSLYIECKLEKPYYCAIDLSDIEFAGFETKIKKVIRIGLSFMAAGYQPVPIFLLKTPWLKKYDIANKYQLKVKQK